MIAPQALRIAVPSLSNSLISLIKDTSLVSVITVTELLRSAQEVIAVDVSAVAALSRRGGCLLGAVSDTGTAAAPGMSGVLRCLRGIECGRDERVVGYAFIASRVKRHACEP